MIFFLRPAALVSNFAASFRLVFPFLCIALSPSLCLHIYTHISNRYSTGRYRQRQRQIYKRDCGYWEQSTVVNVRHQNKGRHAYPFACDCRQCSWSPRTERCDLPPQMVFGTVQGWGLPLPPLCPALTLPDLEKNKNNRKWECDVIHPGGQQKPT